jgi:hypothetical protein
MNTNTYTSRAIVCCAVLCCAVLCCVVQVFLRQLMGDRLTQQYKTLTERCVLAKALVYR